MEIFTSGNVRPAFVLEFKRFDDCTNDLYFTAREFSERMKSQIKGYVSSRQATINLIPGYDFAQVVATNCADTCLRFSVGPVLDPSLLLGNGILFKVNENNKVSAFTLNEIYQFFTNVSYHNRPVVPVIQF